jgi:serine/threonine protein kinase
MPTKSLITNISSIAGTKNAHLDPDLSLFLTELNELVQTSLAPLIKEYNEASSFALCREKLMAIARVKKTMEQRYLAQCYSSCEDYINKIQIRLFDELEAAFEAFGMQREEPDNLAYLIRTMSHTELNDLIQTLIHMKSIGAEIHRFKNYSISAISLNNNYIYQFIHTQTNHAEIVIIENRLDRPKEIGTLLGENTVYVKSPDATRQLSYQRIDSGVATMVTRNIDVLPFYKNGNLENYHEKITGGDQEKVSVALNLYLQMATILSDLQYRYIAFTDMKNSNWIVDDNGQLIILDTKSMTPVEPVTLDYQENLANNRWYGGYYSRVGTPNVNPEEFYSEKFNADSLHVFILGRNLYQFLTGVESRYFQGKLAVDAYNFDRPIFKSAVGRHLAELIKQMIAPEPSKRLKLSQVMYQLQQISNPTETYKKELMSKIVDELSLKSMRNDSQ